MADALNYYKMYEEFSDRARKASNPDTLRWMYQQGWRSGARTEDGYFGQGGRRMIVDAFQYLQQTQRFLREQKQEFLNPADLLVYINRARREVAGRTQSVRRLTPISGQIISTNLVSGGSGYVNPQVTITTPDWPSGALPNPQGRQATRCGADEWRRDHRRHHPRWRRRIFPAADYDHGYRSWSRCVSDS